MFNSRIRGCSGQASDICRLNERPLISADASVTAGLQMFKDKKQSAAGTTLSWDDKYRTGSGSDRLGLTKNDISSWSLPWWWTPPVAVPVATAPGSVFLDPQCKQTQ